jgi:hypothetical protein
MGLGWTGQGLKSLGMGGLLKDEEVAMLMRRYERSGEFNRLVFLRDVDDAEARLAAALTSPHA